MPQFPDYAFEAIRDLSAVMQPYLKSQKKETDAARVGMICGLLERATRYALPETGLFGLIQPGQMVGADMVSGVNLPASVISLEYHVPDPSTIGAETGMYNQGHADRRIALLMEPRALFHDVSDAMPDKVVMLSIYRMTIGPQHRWTISPTAVMISVDMPSNKIKDMSKSQIGAVHSTSSSVKNAALSMRGQGGTMAGERQLAVNYFDVLPDTGAELQKSLGKQEAIRTGMSDARDELQCSIEFLHGLKTSALAITKVKGRNNFFKVEKHTKDTTGAA